MPRPEGYEKRLECEVGEKFHIPVVTIIDTGSFSRIGAEERGQSEAKETFHLASENSIIKLVLGREGLVAQEYGDKLIIRIFDLLFISPEVCSSILWRTPDETERALKQWVFHQSTE